MPRSFSLVRFVLATLCERCRQGIPTTYVQRDPLLQCACASRTSAAVGLGERMLAAECLNGLVGS
jgi:hypothetical protein